MKNVKNSLLLLASAVIWGVAFVAQRVGMDYVGGFTFNAARFLIGFAVLLPVIGIMDRHREETLTRREGSPSPRRSLICGGLCCGLFLGAASNFQQFGIKYTTVGKAGFITACYIVLVPVLGIFLKKSCGPAIWMAVALAVLGLYLLCIQEGFAIGRGDILVMICACLFAVHILIIDHFSPMTDGVKLSCLQFLTSGLISLAFALIFEKPSFGQLASAWVPVLYAGVMSCGVAYTFQILGQKGMDPTVASLILSLESCVSVLAGWLILGQRLSVREGLGCAVMFAAIILAQLPRNGAGTGSGDEST